MTMTRLFLLSALALVAGCSTPPDYYHTLRPSGEVIVFLPSGVVGAS